MDGDIFVCTTIIAKSLGGIEKGSAVLGYSLIPRLSPSLIPRFPHQV